MTALAAPTAVQRVALVASSARQLADLAPPLVARLIDLRHKPICLTPGGAPEALGALAALGAHCDTIELPQGGLGFLQGFGVKGRLAGTLAAHRPHAMIAFDLASAAFVAPMARRAGCQRISAVLATSGVTCSADGDVTIDSAAGAQLQTLAGAGATLGVAGHDEVRFLAALPVTAGATVIAVPQRGIDLADLRAAPLPSFGRSADASFVFATDGAALVSDDVAVLAAAMRILAGEAPGVRLQVLVSQADARSREAVLAAAADIPSIAVFDDGRPFGEEMREAMREAHAYVHPSGHAGLTSGLLTALAAGRPVVATDVAGARETVDQIVNGVLAKPGDPAALAAAMLAVVRRADILPAMAAASRRKAERRFDVTAVNATLLGAIGIPAVLGTAA